MFRTSAGGLSFQYIADDGPNNLPSRLDMIGQRPHITIILSACRFSLGRYTRVKEESVRVQEPPILE